LVLSYIHIHPLDVYRIVKKLPSKVNSSPDCIPYVFIKKCIFSLLPALTHIFQFSLYTGTLPKAWKKAIVVPLLKTAPANVVSNYRPISLTSAFSKIIEKHVYNELYSFFVSKNILPNEQHGFRTGKSTITQLIETFDIITNALDKGSCVDIVYFDFSKAFDTVPFALLLQKLKRAGVSDTLLLWISNFLSDRSFTVKVDTAFSSDKPVLSGVPQGSILGPLLFIFFIHDLIDHCRITDVVVKMYADDVKAFVIHKNLVIQTNNLQNFISKLSQYTDNNGLRLQPSKCYVLYLGPKNKSHTYSLNGSILPTKNVVRDLGLHVSSELKWQQHITIVTKKAISRLHLLFKSIQSHDPSFLIRIYFTYVVPILDYCSPIYNSNSFQNKAIIERVHKTCF
jgi:ribonucleases P/MRP protein subunit RPP40